MKLFVKILKLPALDITFDCRGYYQAQIALHVRHSSSSTIQHTQYGVGLDDDDDDEMHHTFCG
jgi:hypothetical protein